MALPDPGLPLAEADRRHPYRSFEAGLIRDFLQGRELVSATLLPLGRCNSNYRLRLADGGQYALRLRSRGDAAREACVMNLARGLVPVPVEVARGETWSVYTWLEGRMLASVPEEYARAAEALARIASVTFHAAGWIQADGSVTPFHFGEEDGEDFTTVMLGRADVRAWIGPEAAEAVRAIMRREAGRMAEAFDSPRLTHGDFNPTNLLIHEGRISGVLDWEFAHAGTPYMDLGNLLRHAPPDTHEAIRGGLEAGGMRVRQDWKELAALVDVSSQLEFLTSARADAFKQECAGRIHAFAARFRDGV